MHRQDPAKALPVITEEIPFSPCPHRCENRAERRKHHRHGERCPNAPAREETR